MLKGDARGRLCLFRYREGSGCWAYMSTIADPNREGTDFNESDLLYLPDEGLLCVIRTGGGQPLYQSQSSDGGQTWT